MMSSPGLSPNAASNTSRRFSPRPWTSKMEERVVWESTRGLSRCRVVQRRPVPRLLRPRRPRVGITCGGACSTLGATWPPRTSALSTSTSRSPIPLLSTTGFTAGIPGADTAEEHVLDSPAVACA